MTRKWKVKLGLASVGLVLFFTFQNFTKSDAVICKTDAAMEAISYCISQKSHPLLEIIVDEYYYTCGELQNLCSSVNAQIKAASQPASNAKRSFDHIGN